MIQDVFRLAHTTEHPDAVAAFECATDEVAAHRPGAGAALAEALAADPQLVAAHCLKGFAQVILARSELQLGAEAALLSAEQALQAKGGGSEDETLLVFALRRATEGKFHAAADLLEAIIDARPTVFLALKLSHALRFMVGDLAGMLKCTEALAPAYDPALEGYGYFLGCHAFGLEEAGRYEEAERTGRAAALAEPKDAWGIHAVAHVYEMRHQPADGMLGSISSARLGAAAIISPTISLGIRACFTWSRARRRRPCTSMIPKFAPIRPTISATSPTPLPYCGAWRNRVRPWARAGKNWPSGRGIAKPMAR
jgi:tetratricopeptide (TPR) repeat protein